MKHLQCDAFTLDKERLSLRVNGDLVEITSTEYRLLKAMMEREGHIQDRYNLLKEIWGYSDHTYTRTLDTHIKRMRKKLGEYAYAIQTIHGVGYRFSAK